MTDRDDRARRRPCWKCKGTGHNPSFKANAPIVPCHVCQGKGHLDNPPVVR